MLSDGQTRPYGNLRNAQVIQYLLDGRRLECPSDHLIVMKKFFSHITKNCWLEDENARPSAGELLRIVNVFANENKFLKTVNIYANGEESIQQDAGSVIAVEDIPVLPKKKSFMRKIKWKGSLKVR